MTSKRTVMLVVVLATVFSFLAEASAERETSLKDGPSVRRKLLYRSSRVELMPVAGFSMNDAYKRSIMAGAELNYHLTNEFGIGAGAAYGVVHMNTDLLDQIEATIDKEETDSLVYSMTALVGDVHVSYVPLFGKLALARMVVDYDFHLLGGFGGALVGVDGKGPGTDLEGFKPGPMFGGGLRLFFADSIGLTMDIKDYLYSTADVQEGTGNPTSEFRSNPVFSVGVSFFFPGKVNVSR